MCDRLSTRRASAVAVALLVVSASAAQAAYFKSYDANSAVTAPDPTSPEGGAWGLVGTSPTFPVKTAGSDAGSNYWQVIDNNTNPSTGATVNNSAGYAVQTTGAGADPNLVNAFTDPNGWRLTTTLRVLDARVAAAAAGTAPLFLDVRTDPDGGTATGRIFTIGIYQNDPTYGDSVWWLPGGSTATGAGSAVIDDDIDLSTAFHTIDMELDRAASPSTFRVRIDGTEVFSIPETSATASASARAQVFQAASGATHTVQYQSFTFQTIPEPAAGAVFALAGIGGLAARRRRHAIR